MIEWTIDYGNGPNPIKLPHAWRQDVPVTWEGPAVYRTSFNVQHDDEWLVFHGCSYEARVFIKGNETVHRGIWDEFAVWLGDHAGKQINIEVHVTKNGGSKFPVKSVLSGFLPYVFNTFGGLYGGVSIVRSPNDPTLGEQPNYPHRVEVKGRDIYVDGNPFYMRGVLSWGWYPELGHTNPSDEEIRKEIKKAQELGFNTIKFCLWVPRHRFFEIMEEEGMFAWLELPLWNPERDSKVQENMRAEIERIVSQYRHHRTIIAWTIGCELGSATESNYRQALVEMVQKQTGCPLVKDDSGGAEMYGGDLTEYGTFDDFHPYCDTHFYPLVLDSLRQGPRTKRPVLLGEFNDFDVHRNLVDLKENTPYWAKDSKDLNDQGVRWQYDLPCVIRESRFVGAQKVARSDSPEQTGLENSSFLMKSSISKGAWVRRKVMEHVRACEDISGYVITGWRHTPISTSGMVDDDLNPVFPQESTARWNGPISLFLIPYRKPAWINGGNRPGWLDLQSFFEGDLFFKIGIHSDIAISGRLEWKLGTLCGSCNTTSVNPLDKKLVYEIAARGIKPGEYLLEVSFNGLTDSWPISVVRKPDWSREDNWGLSPDVQREFALNLKGKPNLITTLLDSQAIEAARNGASIACFLLDDVGTKSMPFWRECAFEFEPGLLDPYIDNWERLFGIATDLALDSAFLTERLGNNETLMNRIDTRTYAEHPYLVTAKIGKGKILVTTLRPQGGHGVQATGIDNNPSGSAFLKRIIEGDW